MKTLIIHHHDLDGYVAGDIALLKYPDAETLSLGYDHPEQVPDMERLGAYAMVVIVDYCLPAPQMTELCRRGTAVWIDHHVSAIRAAVEHGFDALPGLRSAPDASPECGAELAWRFFMGGEPPRFVRLVGEYDTFRSSHDPVFDEEVMPFFYATQLHFEQEYLPANAAGEHFRLRTAADFQDEARCEEMLRQGRLIRDYVEEYYRRAVAESAYVRDLWGFRVLCFNCYGHGSVVVKPGFDPQKHDLMMRYSYNGCKWGYGLFTDAEVKPDVDVSAIARRYGGGGHRTAAGFSTDELLPELK